MRILREHLAKITAGRSATGVGKEHPIGIWILAGVLAACGSKKQAPPPPLPATVKVITLTSQTVNLITDLPGRTVPFKVAEIRPQVSGVILKRMFVEGSDVKEGQQLYQIDPALYQAAYNSAAASARWIR